MGVHESLIPAPGERCQGNRSSPSPRPQLTAPVQALGNLSAAGKTNEVDQQESVLVHPTVMVLVEKYEVQEDMCARTSSMQTFSISMHTGKYIEPCMRIFKLTSRECKMGHSDKL